MEVDWDLGAVVRSCTAKANAVGGAPPPPPPPPPHFSTTMTTTDASLKDWSDSFPTTYQDPFFPITETSFAASELHEAYKPFYPKQQQGRNATLSLKPSLSPWSLPISPLSVINGLPDRSGEQQKLMNFQSIAFEQLPPQIQHHLPKAPAVCVSQGPKASPPRSKKRKNKAKKICHVPVEELKKDGWTWRKYGKKIIKGTPHPRTYYKCTLKACPARRFVQTNRSNPGMSIVTYVSDHNHPIPPKRSSAAGTSRSAAASASASGVAAASSVADVPSPVRSNPEKLDAQSLDHEVIVIEDDDVDLFIAPDVPIEDDFFDGVEDFMGQELGEDDLFEGLEDLTGQQSRSNDISMDDFFKDT